MSSQPSGSTMAISASGHARARPDAKPPPPQQDMIMSGPVRPNACSCSATSSPAVPCPSITQGSPKACTSVAPLCAIKPAATSSRDSVARSYKTTSAPSALVASSFIRGAFDGITIVAAIPSFFAAHATPWAWFPLDTPTTPRVRSPSSRSDSRCQAPLILNAPIG